MVFRKGTLWESIVNKSERAREEGSLLPIPTHAAFIEERGIRFFVRVLSALNKKAEARKQQDAEARTGRIVNPFLPPEKELTVAEISETHLAVLNKFNVVDHHLLIVTRRFEDQTTLLTLKDFEALWSCMGEYESLGFYNGGREAGASQEHKHLQVVPLPLSPDGTAVPVERMFPARDASSRICTVPGFSFRHWFARLTLGNFPAAECAVRSFELYSALLDAAGMKRPERAGATVQSAPYCLLVAREWMLLVPRSREHFEDISINSLAFAGSFFVKNEEQLERIRRAGPLNVLRSVASGASTAGSE